MALADRNPAAAVDLRCQRDAALEFLERQRRQLVGLGDEVEADGGQPARQDPCVLGCVDRGDLLVQFAQRGNVGDQDEVRAPEASALVFDTTLLVGAFLAGDAVEGVEADLPWVQEI
ncbi:hypothetical protein OG568_54090 (plasmid) [Streptomyces sp. NBC_01450]|uniref:hypothetical protein n=1 Tax=Streptomyces sp. NBC_01450 TaxID=2903871 RepID=UPI002E3421AB|nr:hypothetical protein [Streptomyces sp. NBC_01450]